MENKIELAVSEARKYLEHPRDATHDLNHHEAVWENCKSIVKNENLKVDLGLIKIAAFWHDVVLEKESETSSDNVVENVNYLEKFLPEIGFDVKEIKIILDAVLHHEFRDIPVNVEGMVLQDADKLDVLSKDRWGRTIESFENGKMSEEKYTSYLRTGLKWFNILESTFHYKYSKNIAKEFIDSVYNDAKLVEAINKVGMQKELDDSKRSMNSLRTRVLRIAINLTNFRTNLIVCFRKIFI